MNLNNSSSLVTGGASGLGLAVAQMLVQAGSHVAVLDLASPEAEAQVNALGSAAFFCPADVTRPDEVRAALAQVASAGKSLQLAVNCAGVGIAGKILQKGEPADQSIFEKTVAINLFGTFNVCRYGLTYQ